MWLRRPSCRESQQAVQSVSPAADLLKLSYQVQRRPPNAAATRDVRPHRAHIDRAHARWPTPRKRLGARVGRHSYSSTLCACMSIPGGLQARCRTRRLGRESSCASVGSARARAHAHVFDGTLRPSRSLCVVVVWLRRAREGLACASAMWASQYKWWRMDRAGSLETAPHGRDVMRRRGLSIRGKWSTGSPAFATEITHRESWPRRRECRFISQSPTRLVGLLR